MSLLTDMELSLWLTGKQRDQKVDGNCEKSTTYTYNKKLAMVIQVFTRISRQKRNFKATLFGK